jgi:hypothetical protein
MQVCVLLVNNAGHSIGNFMILENEISNEIEKTRPQNGLEGS